MSTPNPQATAAQPIEIAVLEALLQFNANIGPDPTKWALTVPGAFTILLGTVQLQVPALAQSEAGAIQGEVNAKLTAAIAAIKAKQ
jgi:hypothetical protein